VLLSYLVLFGFVYPSERANVPPGVLEDLVDRLRREGMTAGAERVCLGTLLSRAQYLTDVGENRFKDARLDPRCNITVAELESWTASIPAPLRN
jgi:hypothetical protein